MFGVERVKVYRDSLGEFSTGSYGVFGVERVKVYRDSLGEFSTGSYGVFGVERVKVYRDSLGEFSTGSYGVFGAERVKKLYLPTHVTLLLVTHLSTHRKPNNLKKMEYQNKLRKQDILMFSL